MRKLPKSFNKLCWNTRTATCNKANLDTKLSSFTKITQTGLDLNISLRSA